MRTLICFFSLFFTIQSVVAQTEELHQATIVGSFPYGELEVTTIYDETTGCERKTSPHEAGLFLPEEAVQLRFTENAEMAEVVKSGLAAQVFATKDCIDGARLGPTEVVDLSCNGTCDCSLEGVLSGEAPYVQCSCDDCTMQVEFSESGKAGDTSTYNLNDPTTMVVPLLDEFLLYAEANFESFKLTHITIYKNESEEYVLFLFTDENDDEHSTMFSRAGGKKFQITCEGPCGCREIYSFETNSASCSCEDCTMTVEEVSSN